MTTLTVIVRELIGLFVDDGALALAIIAVVVIAAISGALLPGMPMVTGAILLVGCLAVLLFNVARFRR